MFKAKAKQKAVARRQDISYWEYTWREMKRNWIAYFMILPYVVIFSCSAVPGKPLLRKRLQFFAWMNLYLTALMFLYSQDFLLYYIWSLPSLAVMLAYVFSLNVTRFSRFYFIVVNVILLAIVPFCLWLNRL